MPVFDPTQLEEEVFSPFSNEGIRFLTQENVEMIEEALHSLGEYGEVRLIVAKGRLRFLIKCSSEKVAAD